MFGLKIKIYIIPDHLINTSLVRQPCSLLTLIAVLSYCVISPEIVGEPLALRVPPSSLTDPETVPLPVRSRILAVICSDQPPLSNIISNDWVGALHVEPPIPPQLEE